MTNAKPPLPPDDLDEPVVEAVEEAFIDERVPSEPPPQPTPPTPPAEQAPPPPPVAPAAPAMAPAPAPMYANPMDKSPGLALFLSIFFPGLGHIYVASYERAVMIISTIALCISAIAFTDGRLWPLGFVIAFTYFFALFDAYREAQIANLADDQEMPKPRGRGEGRLVFGVFLSVLSILVLADNLGLFDITWVYDWWPVLVLIVGLYFIGSWIWEKMNAGGSSGDSSFD